MNPLLEGIRIRFSTFIAENVPDNRKSYYYEKINAIPDNALDTKFPFMIKKKLRNLDKIMTTIAAEMEEEKINTQGLRQSIIDLANDLKDADKKFLRI